MNVHLTNLVSIENVKIPAPGYVESMLTAMLGIIFLFVFVIMGIMVTHSFSVTDLQVRYIYK